MQGKENTANFLQVSTGAMSLNRYLLSTPTFTRAIKFLSVKFRIHKISYAQEIFEGNLSRKLQWRIYYRDIFHYTNGGDSLTKPVNDDDYPVRL